MTINDEVEIYYCSQCEGDVKATLVLHIASLDEINRALVVELDAICKECGTTLFSNSATMSL